MKQQRVGILGGGQLARMLAESAFRLGMRPLVLAEGAAAPAAQVCPGSVFGSDTDPAALRRFFAQVELVAFENEFVDCDAIEEAVCGMGSGSKPEFYPEVSVIRKLRDKLGQKECLKGLGIPSAEHDAYPEGERELRGWIAALVERFGGACVLKWAKFGYDGKGTCFVRGSRGPELDAAAEFCERGLARGTRVYAERMVPFRREVSVVACRSVAGEFAAYPLVVSEQRAGTCLRVTGPASSLGVAPGLELEAHAQARRLAEGAGLVGCFAVELFETRDGGLSVNEIAPRVHNTGHFTQDGAATSQFENHWRAVLGLPLGSVQCAPSFAMLNLLGPEGVALSAVEAGASALPQPGGRAHLHWYGKSELRSGRKLGHLNAAAWTEGQVQTLVEELHAIEAEWAEGLRQAKRR